jgi:hypothetical protein
MLAYLAGPPMFVFVEHLVHGRLHSRDELFMNANALCIESMAGVTQR